ETYIHSRGDECIFFPKFHCKLNPIEMFKYHYCEGKKKTFKDAKEAAPCFLQECPKEVIQHFIN
ncbi:hypothetical protein L208DRAFT_1330774, partial [Tricholoma matsutake]